MKDKLFVIVAAVTVALLVGAGGYLLGTRLGAGAQTGQPPGVAGMPGGQGGALGGPPGAGAGGAGAGGAGAPGAGGAQGGYRSGPDGTGMVAGKVISKEKGSITVSLPQGGSKTVYLSGSTRYETITRGSAADVSVGETVTAFGTAGSDGGVTARSVTVVKR